MEDITTNKGHVVLTPEDISNAIEVEGLEYTFLDYYSIEKFPTGLREKVRDLKNAMAEIEAWLEANGVEY